MRREEGSFHVTITQVASLARAPAFVLPPSRAPIKMATTCNHPSSNAQTSIHYKTPPNQPAPDPSNPTARPPSHTLPWPPPPRRPRRRLLSRPSLPTPPPCLSSSSRCPTTTWTPPPRPAPASVAAARRASVAALHVLARLGRHRHTHLLPATPAPRGRPRLGAHPHRRSARGTSPSSTTSASGTSGPSTSAASTENAAPARRRRASTP